VLIIPYCVKDKIIKYGIFHRRDMNVWQFIAGGGEDEDESLLFSAKREAFEEAKISMNEKYFKLDTQCSIATECFKKARMVWGEDCLVIPEYSFAVKINEVNLELSNEHIEYEWVNYETAIKRLKYDSNKVALWELDNKIKLGLID
jgi:dATP pyrophosphohydrolase